jgi:hypothetical protein
VYQGEPQDIRILPETVDPAGPTLEIGTQICVRDRFLGNWSSGFVVAGVLPGGYHIRRLSDGLTFPDLFPVDDVRMERRREPDRGIAGSYLDRGF